MPAGYASEEVGHTEVVNATAQQPESGAGDGGVAWEKAAVDVQAELQALLAENAAELRKDNETLALAGDNEVEEDQSSVSQAAVMAKLKQAAAADIVRVEGGSDAESGGSSREGAGSGPEQPPGQAPRPALVHVRSHVGEDCAAACHRVGEGDLACDEDGFPEVNECGMLNAAFGCGGDSKCLAMEGGEKPAAVLLPGEAAPVCFLAADSFHGRTRTACEEASPLAQRLCPCAVHSRLANANAMLKHALQHNMRQKVAEQDRVAALAGAVGQLIQRFNGTAATLAATQAHLAKLQAIDAAEAEIADIMKSLQQRKVDYETGMVTLKDGSKMSSGEAMQRLKQLHDQARAGHAQWGDGEHSVGKGQGAGPPERPAEGALGGPPAGGDVADGGRQGAPVAGPDAEAPLLPDPAMLHYDIVLLQDIGVLMCVAALGGLAFSALHLPPGFGFLVMGMAVGPNGFNILHSTPAVSSVAQFGVVFPLFRNGMLFGSKFKNTVATTRAAVQASVLLMLAFTAVTMAGGALTGLTAGPSEGLLVGLALSLSSPAVAIGNLHLAGALSSQGGQVSLAMLAVQDLIMGFLLSMPNAWAAAEVRSGTHEAPGSAWSLSSALGISDMDGALLAAWSLLQSGIAFAALVALVQLLSRGALQRGAATAWASLAARLPCVGRQRCCSGLHMPLQGSPEEGSGESSADIFLLGLVSSCLVGALTTQLMGLSLEMGAFVAGLALASAAPYPIPTLTAAVTPLSGLFGAMFLASVGLVLSPTFMLRHAWVLLAALAFLLAAKAGLLYIILRAFRLQATTAATAAVAMAQMAEFGLAFTGKAHAMGMLSRKVYLLVLTITVVGTLTSPLLVRLREQVVWLLHRLDSSAEDGSASAGGPGDLPKPKAQGAPDTRLWMGAELWGQSPALQDGSRPGTPQPPPPPPPESRHRALPGRASSDASQASDHVEPPEAEEGSQASHSTASE